MNSHSEVVPRPGGQTLTYFRYGTRGGMPVVLLHGLSQQADFWKPTIRVLSSCGTDDFDVIAVDQRGHGASQGFSADHDLSIDALATDVEAVMNHAEVANALIVGHSMGAMVAVHCAYSLPIRVNGLLLMDGAIRTPADNFPDSSPSREKLISYLTPPAGPFTETTLREYYGQLAPTNIQEVMAAVARTYTPSDGGGFTSTLGFARHMQFIDSILDYDPREMLESLSVPTWAILCQNIEGTAIDPARLWDHFANQAHIQMQHWYGCAHDVPLQRPEMIASLVRSVARVCID